MKACVKVSGRDDKKRIELALAEPKVLHLVRAYGDVLAMPDGALKKHCLTFFDSVLCSTADPAHCCDPQ